MLLRHHLQRRQDHQHGEGKPLPGVGDDDGGERPIGVGDQRRQLPAERLQRPIERADVGRVDHFPDDGDDDRRQHHRDQKHGAQRQQQGRAQVEQQGEGKTQQKLQADGPERQLGLHPKTVVEAAILQQDIEVAQRLAEIGNGLGLGEVERRQAGGDEKNCRCERHGKQHRQRRYQQTPVNALARGAEFASAAHAHASCRQQGRCHVAVRGPDQSGMPAFFRSAMASSLACCKASRAPCCLLAMRSIALLILSPTCGKTGTVRYFM